MERLTDVRARSFLVVGGRDFAAGGTDQGADEIGQRLDPQGCDETGADRFLKYGAECCVGCALSDLGEQPVAEDADRVLVNDPLERSIGAGDVEADLVAGADQIPKVGITAAYSWRLLLFEEAGQSFAEVFVQALDDGTEHVLLAVEVVVERAARHSCSLRDVIDPGVGVATLSEQVSRRRQQRFASVGGVLRSSALDHVSSMLHTLTMYQGQVTVVSEWVVRATGVVKRYGRRTVLDGIDLVVKAGEATALVGENGAGKTTLLRACAGLERLEAGEIDVRGRIGYCPQEPGVLDHLDANEHIVLFGRGMGLDPDEALDTGREILHQLHFPVGDPTLASDLSGGSRQKLNLALALLGSSDVLLLDEPYQGFDHGTYVDFWNLIDSWRAEGRAIVIVTHMLTELNRVDHVVELSIDARRDAA